MKKILAMMVAMVLAFCGMAMAEERYYVDVAEFSPSMASYAGEWFDCCHGNYCLYLPADTIIHEVTPEQAAQDMVELYEFSDGMIAVFHKQFGRSYYIMDAYEMLQETYDEDHLMLTEYNSVPSLMYTDESTMHLVLSDRWKYGVYDLVAIPFGEQFIEDSHTAFLSVQQLR